MFTLLLILIFSLPQGGLTQGGRRSNGEGRPLKPGQQLRPRSKPHKGDDDDEDGKVMNVCENLVIMVVILVVMVLIFLLAGVSSAPPECSPPPIPSFPQRPRYTLAELKC